MENIISKNQNMINCVITNFYYDLRMSYHKKTKFFKFEYYKID